MSESRLRLRKSRSFPFSRRVHAATMIMNRISLIALLVLCASLAIPLRAQESPSGLEAAAAIEKTLVDVIARTEKSVVAIARVRRERPGEVFQLEPRPDPFGRRPMPLAPPQPTDPDFIPNEYAAGVFVGPGLVLTAAHVLGDESDYYVTTIQHKVYKATVRAADPRSDLAVLAIEATDLPPISFGNADELKKGQIVIGLGNPYAIARDGQPSAAWGIVANLQRKAPATPSESDPTGRPALYHYGTLIQTDAKLGLGTSGGPLLNLRGEMVGLSVALAATAGYESAGGYAIPVDATFRRAVETLKRGREVEYGFLGIQPMNLLQEEVLARIAGDAGLAGHSRHARRPLWPEARRRDRRRRRHAAARFRRAGAERRQAARRRGHAAERAGAAGRCAPSASS